MQQNKLGLHPTCKLLVPLHSRDGWTSSRVPPVGWAGRNGRWAAM